jgi:hypothetical protein
MNKMPQEKKSCFYMEAENSDRSCFTLCLIFISVPDRRRFGHDYVICVIVLHVLAGREGRRGRASSGGLGKRPQMGS